MELKIEPGSIKESLSRSNDGQMGAIFYRQTIPQYLILLVPELGQHFIY